MERKSCCSGRGYVTSTCGTTPKKETVATDTVKKEAAAGNIVKTSDMANCGATLVVVEYPKTEEEKKPCVSSVKKEEEPVKVNIGFVAACGFKPT